MTDFSLVSCSYVPKTINENLDATTGHITASLTLRCLWDDRLNLADDVLLNRRAYPFITSTFTPKALTCSIIQFDEDYNQVTVGQWRPPKFADVTVNYGVPASRAIGSFDLVAESLEPFGDFLRQDYTLFRWSGKDGDPLKPEEAPGRFMPKLKLVRRIYRVETLPSNALSAIGKCNIASYASPLLGVTFPVETLVYGEPSLERTISTTGSDGWNYTQQWTYDPNTWNKYWRPETQSWEYIYMITASGTAVPWKCYEPTDFSGLLL
jgi:hypothetical protein